MPLDLAPVLAPRADASLPVTTGELVTVEGVPVLETGREYPASTGPVTITTEILDAIVESQDDPMIPAPRIKIGHIENPVNDDLQAMFEQAREEAGESDWEPAIGTIQNLRISDDGQKLLGDWTGVPKWFAEVLASAYPARSIEGGAWQNEANAKQYDFGLMAVSLLGAAWPGVTSLADLAELFSDDGPEGIEIVEMKGATMPAVRAAAVAAQVSVDDIRRAFYEDFCSGDRYWWWDRELLVNPDEFIVQDPDANQLYRVPFDLKTQTGDEPDEVEFGDPEPIKIKYVPDKKAAQQQKDDTPAAAVRLVSAEIENTGRVIAVNTEPVRTKEEDSMPPINLEALRAHFDLAEDATEDEINAKLTAESAEPETPPAPGDDPDPDAADAPAEEEAEEEGDEPATPSPEASTRQVDTATFDQMQADAKAGREARTKQVTDHRTAVLNAAITDGRIPPARREHWAQLFESDPEGTEVKLSADEDKGGLAKGLIPVDERGGAPEETQASATAYPETWFPEAQAARESAEPAAAGGAKITRGI